MNHDPHNGFTYFPGCSLMVTNRAYDVSTRNVTRVLGIEMIELEDWNCCGATAYMALEEKKSAVLCARNLALAEQTGRDLVTVCNACYVAMRKTNLYFKSQSPKRAALEKALAAGGVKYRGSLRVRHLLEVLVNDLGEETIRRHVVHPLSHLKVAAYSGCQLSRPFEDTDDPEAPRLLNDLTRWCGAEPIDFPMAAKCCGGMMMTTRPPLGLSLTGKILQVAKAGGADCIITACPLCQMNLEAYQAKAGKELGVDLDIPVLYFTQLLGSAFGLGARELALKDALTDVTPLELVRGGQ